MQTRHITREQQHYLNLMGITVWLDRERQPEQQKPPVTAAGGTAVATAPDWETLQKRVAACTRCELHRGRTQTVFGTGDPGADWMLIGEAPGAEEDRQGKPFVGRAGKLLNAMLEAIGLDREHVYIANILKCRPPRNRDPSPAEVTECEPYLKQQIDMIRPKIILALGRIAAQNLLKVELPIGRMRGQCYEYADTKIPVVVTYHPAYLLRSPREKRKSWLDLQLAMKIYQENR